MSRGTHLIAWAIVGCIAFWAIVLLTIAVPHIDLTLPRF